LSSNLYASLSEFKERIGIANDDQTRDFALDHVLEGSSRWIDNILGRRFYTTTADETIYYTATNNYWHLPVEDLLSVTTLATDANGDGVYETSWTVGTDYWLGPKNAVIDGEPYRFISKAWPTGRFNFPAWENAIQVVGKRGYSTLAARPAAIRELCLMVAEVDAMPLLDLVIAGTATYKLGAELTVTMGGKNLPPLARTIIDQYARNPGHLG
jgi:hypothetical protein